MAIDKAVFKQPRVALLCVELLFSILVFCLSCAWVDALPMSQVNFALFVGLTSMILTGFFLYVYATGKNTDPMLRKIEALLFILYFIFWLSAAAALADATAWANKWYGGLEGTNCGTASALNVFSQWCKAYDRVPVLRADCAFAWLAFFAWIGSIYFIVTEDIMKDKIFSSGSAAPADAKQAPVKVASVKQAAAAPPAATNV